MLFGYATNQINVLWKLITIATNETPENPIEQRVSGAQTQIIVRLLIGVLWEAWRLVERLRHSEVGKDLVPKLDPPARDALERLKKFFGGSNLISNVRNDFGFHYPKPDDMEAAFQIAAASAEMEEADWGVYFTRTLLNTFFRRIAGARERQGARMFECERASPAFGHDWTYDLLRFARP